MVVVVGRRESIRQLHASSSLLIRNSYMPDHGNSSSFMTIAAPLFSRFQVELFRPPVIVYLAERRGRVCNHECDGELISLLRGK